jgi:NitT/TauT family transport system ATP-binding protein
MGGGRLARSGRNGPRIIPARQARAATRQAAALQCGLPSGSAGALPRRQSHEPPGRSQGEHRSARHGGCLMTHFVDFRNVWLAYNKDLLAQNRFAVEDITLQMDEGEFIAIVGPSGCGKSTFMKLATGLNMPSRGSIHIDAKPVTGPLKISGMAFQAPSLLPWRTTLDNVLLPLEIVEPYRSSFRARRDEYVDKARKLLHSVGLHGYEDKFPWQLSGGMQQRASICRALVHEPKMLLLDEPFGALDAFTREELWCAMRDLQSAQKFNVILVTHDLRESVFLADTVYVMSKSPGRVIVKRPIDLPRPRDLELTYTPRFTDIVHELRGHIGAMRQPAGPGVTR